MGHEPFRKSQMRKSPSCAVANKFPETRLKPTCVAPAENVSNQVLFIIIRLTSCGCIYSHMQTALKDIIGFFGSRKSHRCVNVSIEQLANKCGVFECQSISVMTRVCARNEWISVGSPKRHVTTSINWLVAIAQYSCDS